MSYAYGLGCCCSAPCAIASDDFDRADDLDINVGAPVTWDIRSMTSPEVFSNALVSGTSDDLIICTTPHPESLANAVVAVDITLADDADEAKIVVNHDGSDDDTYHFALVRNYDITLYERSGGTDTAIVCASIDLPNNPTVTVYMDAESSGRFSATCGDAEIHATVNPWGIYAGLGTGSVTNSVQFDNWTFTRHRYDTNSCPQLISCLIQRDDFSRPGSSSLGCAWTEVSGTWDINSNKLRNTSAGIAILNEPHPTGTTMMVEATYEQSSSSGRADIIVGYVDSSNYFYARYAPAGGAGSIDIRKCVAGTHSSITLIPSVTMNTNTPYPVKVIVDEAGRISAYQGSIGGTSTPQTITGTQCGLRSDVAGTALFTDFAFSKAYHSSDDPGCEQASLIATCNRCQVGTTYFTYKLVISGVVNAGCTNCSVINGIYFLDAFDMRSDQRCEWCSPLSGAVDCTGLSGLLLNVLAFYIDQASPGLSTHRLNVVPQETCTSGGGGIFTKDTGVVTTSQVDCTFNVEDIPSVGAGLTCGGGTCTVTAYA